MITMPETSHQPEITVVIQEDITADLIDFFRSRGWGRVTLVADHNTYQAQGGKVEQALTESGVQVNRVIVAGEEIIAGGESLMQVLAPAGTVDSPFVAVGSGTITDITRFVSHRTHNPFVAVPTAPSVDGFTSVVAPIVVDGLKITVIAQPPLAVFASLDVLRKAPPAMIAAGFGDMIGKYTALACWRIGHLVWDDPFDEAIASRVRAALDACAESAEEIGRASQEGVRRVMSGLIESGLCMVAFGRSAPASGAEHHLSHYWEMKLMRDGLPAVLHGAKVGVATILIARRYEALRAITRDEAAERLQKFALPDRRAEEDKIRAGYGPLAERIIAEHKPFLGMTAERFMQLKQRVLDRWEGIQQAASTVPPPDHIAALIRQAGGPVDAAALGLPDDYQPLALAHAHYLRNTITMNKLAWLLGME
jgi:glycerol-1-phosphate dehydrogenase [NAD(P)+]